MSDSIYVVPRGDSWAVRREGEPHDISTHASRHEAMEVGKGLSDRTQCQLVVHEVERRSRPREAHQPAFVTHGV